jgi:dTMP kinase
VLDEYDRLVDEYGLSVVNATGSITDQQRVFRKLVSQHLEIKDDSESIADDLV